MKYLEVRQDALELIEKERAEADKAKREAGAKRIKRLMLEIEQAKGMLATMERQLEELMEKEVKDPDRWRTMGVCLGTSGTLVLNDVVIGELDQWEIGQADD